MRVYVALLVQFGAVILVAPASWYFAAALAVLFSGADTLLVLGGPSNDE